MANETILLILSDPEASRILRDRVLIPAGFRITEVNGWKAVEDSLQNAGSPDLVILSEKVEDQDSSLQVRSLVSRFPFLPVLLLPDQFSNTSPVEAIRAGFFDCLQVPLEPVEVLNTVGRALERRQRWVEYASREARQSTESLDQRIDSLEAIERIGRKVASLLDLDHILASVVEAAVQLCAAEEGSLLLLDENTGELYIRAQRNFQQELVSTFRLPVSDPLAAQVLRTGKPLLINEKTPRKIKTSFFVYSLLCVPLLVQEHVIGILEVDHRHSGRTFESEQVTMLMALAGYAAIAIENARLYSHSESERLKLESILTGIEEALVVVDHDRRLVLINRKACEAFGIEEQNLISRRVSEVFPASELLEILVDPDHTGSSRIEVNLADGRVLNAQITALSEIGLVVSMQDITHLKELDRIKGDFVNTVSHDLRSPLTAILGYVELIGRVGSLNPQQREFIHRIEISVNNITALINDLLDLGRIETGFDVRKEVVPLAALIQYTVDGMKNRFAEKRQDLQLTIANDLPPVLGNPIRLRQMLSNLINNSIKYTPDGGTITISAQAEAGQIILQFNDTGFGIPPTDLPYVFDKFYRASNVPLDAPGTGLGLAIVKSIVENHRGRVWVDSALGHGTRFTIVLPTADQNL
jgi:two-component system, OmpR family, phosphate regulon sensor histidine kinase PhoR